MLKPCPFCGGEVDYNERGKVQCARACIAIDAEGYENEWNRRPVEDAMTARAEKAENIINDACAILRSPDMTNDGGCGLVDDVECLAHNYRVALEDIEKAETERDEARRERDEARAKIAAAVEWAAANKPFGGNGTISNEIHASMAEGDRLDVILSDAPALAVVEGLIPFERTGVGYSVIVGTGDYCGPVTVVVLHANAVLERGVDHPTLSEG